MATRDEFGPYLQRNPQSAARWQPRAATQAPARQRTIVARERRTIPLGMVRFRWNAKEPYRVTDIEQAIRLLEDISKAEVRACRVYMRGLEEGGWKYAVLEFARMQRDLLRRRVVSEPPTADELQNLSEKLLGARYNVKGYLGALASNDFAFAWAAARRANEEFKIAFNRYQMIHRKWMDFRESVEGGGEWGRTGLECSVFLLEVYASGGISVLAKQAGKQGLRVLARQAVGSALLTFYKELAIIGGKVGILGDTIHTSDIAMMLIKSITSGLATGVGNQVANRVKAEMAYWLRECLKNRN